MKGLLQRLRRPPERALTLSRLVDKLTQGHDPSHEEIAFVLRERASAVPRLHAILEDASRWSQLPDAPWHVQIHAFFLLAALEAPEGLAPTLQLLRKPREFVDDFFGDLLTECLSWALARLGNTDPYALRVLAGDSTLDPYLRSAAARGLMAQALVWPAYRTRVIHGLGELLAQALDDPDPDWPGLLAGDASDLAAQELRSAIDALFDRGCVNLQFIRRQDIEAAYRTPPTDLTETMDVFRLYDTHLKALWDEPPDASPQATAQEVPETWDDQEPDVVEEAVESLRAPTVPDAIPASRTKVGRNEPCPCGSGIKHKRCCLNAPSETVVGRILTRVGSAMTIEQLTAAIREAIPATSPTSPTDVLRQALRRAQGPPDAVEFASDAQSRLFLTHFKALWNRLGTPQP